MFNQNYYFEINCPQYPNSDFALNHDIRHDFCLPEVYKFVEIEIIALLENLIEGIMKILLIILLVCFGKIRKRLQGNFEFCLFLPLP